MKDGPGNQAMQTPRDLLPGFYRQYNLDADGGQSSPFVKIEFTEYFSLYFPNYDARRKAVFKHDVHHIVTGYPSTFKGETEISAWEIGSKCRHYWAALGLDLQGMMAGLLFNLPGVFRAYVRGRRTTNLYNDQLTDEQVMDTPVAEIRKNLFLDKHYGQDKGRFKDYVRFMGVLIPGVLYSIISLLMLPFILIYSLYAHFILKNRINPRSLKNKEL